MSYLPQDELVYGRSFFERHGGLLISIAIHILILGWLLNAGWNSKPDLPFAKEVPSAPTMREIKISLNEEPIQESEISDRLDQAEASEGSSDVADALDGFGGPELSMEADIGIIDTLFLNSAEPSEIENAMQSIEALSDLAESMAATTQAVAEIKPEIPTATALPPAPPSPPEQEPDPFLDYKTPLLQAMAEDSKLYAADAVELAAFEREDAAFERAMKAPSARSVVNTSKDEVDIESVAAVADRLADAALHPKDVRRRQAARSEASALQAVMREQELRGSKKVRAEIDKLQAGDIAQKTLFRDSDMFTPRGGAVGAVRNIDLGGVPQDQAQLILERYGIKIIVVKLDKPVKAEGFLNSATTQQGKFYSMIGRGTLQAFTFGSLAVGRMIELEESAIHKRGFDPKATVVESVTFGVGPSVSGGYDLIIKSMKCRPVEMSKAKGPLGEESSDLK